MNFSSAEVPCCSYSFQKISWGGLRLLGYGPSCFSFSLPSPQSPLSFFHRLIKVILHSPPLAGTSPLGCFQYCVQQLWRDRTAPPYHLTSLHLCRTHVFIHQSRPSR